ncbi:benzoylformate decarboxylase [uncultured Psychrobacter sp.]|uniref:benzoylformate decarboxylase n=1 Tax=uncultured Psychrobacter sp. TaxID=259303 RepID=UPI003458C911
MSNNDQSNASKTVHDVVYDLMRKLGMTKVFGNPGSTELNFLTNFPEDFEYVLALQEASAVAMADGYAQATGNAAFINLHSAAGVGNGLGNVFTAYRNHTPLVITAGQQARSILELDPYLAAMDAAEFPKPYVKWSIEPASAEEVPRAIAKAYEIAMQHPRGPTFVSIPSDDWDKPAVMPAYSKVIGGSIPSPDAMDQLVQSIKDSQNFALVVGSDIDRQGAFNLAVDLAECLQAPVYEAPNSSRASFPEDHLLFAGFLPALPDKLSDKLADYDVVLVIGAPVFTIHIEGDMPLYDSDTKLYQITADPMYAASASNTTTLIGTITESITALLEKLPKSDLNPVTEPMRPAAPEVEAVTPISINYALKVLSEERTKDSIITEEAPSHRPAIQRYLPITQPNGFYTMASGGLGYSLPASVGVALATDKRVICVIGDGSSMYSIQAIWTAVRHNLPITIVVLNNFGYGAMRDFSKILGSQAVPGLDIKGIDYVQLAQSMGADGVRIDNHEKLAEAYQTAMTKEGCYLIDVVIDPDSGAIY